MIGLTIEPSAKKTWEQFVRENPSHSIAIDGYVNASPDYDSEGLHLNLDHHEGVDRLATDSTCRQMFLCIKMGLFVAFQKDGIPTAMLFGNDCDQDVCVTHFIAENHERFVGAKSEPRLMQLVNLVDLLDTTGGLYPIDTSSRIKKEINWIFHPYTEARTGGKLEKMSGEEMVRLVKSVGERIKAYANGRGGQMESDTRYDMLHKGKGWIMFREIGADARYKACTEHEGGYVMQKESVGHDHYHYSIGKKSKFYPFPVKKILCALNAAEGPDVPTLVMDKSIPRPTWGGSDIIGGSPRVFGSCLTPEEVIKIVEGVLPKAA
ncbi:MAG: hypothetical protein Q8L24_02770 [bacterium]|nr:hypothetical protein [bacterium]